MSKTMGRPPRKWSPREIMMLGKTHDTEVAKLLNVGYSAVARKRHELGITALSKGNPRKWTSRELQMLGDKTDVAVAELLNVNTKTVSRKRHAIGIPAPPKLKRP